MKKFKINEKYNGLEIYNMVEGIQHVEADEYGVHAVGQLITVLSYVPKEMVECDSESNEYSLTFLYVGEVDGEYEYQLIFINN